MSGNWVNAASTTVPPAVWSAVAETIATFWPHADSTSAAIANAAIPNAARRGGALRSRTSSARSGIKRARFADAGARTPTLVESMIASYIMLARAGNSRPFRARSENVEPTVEMECCVRVRARLY